MSQRQPPQDPLIHVVVSGGLGGAFADSVMHSMDTVKTRLQGQLTARNQKYLGMNQAISTIIREEGVRGLYGGFLSAAVGSLLGTTIYFGSYEYIKRDLIERGVSPTLSFFVAASVGDVIASFVYVPSEVLKTRLQLQGRYNNPHSLSAHNYRHTWHALSSIMSKRGMHGLYYGWWATLLRDVPFAAIQFTIYESLKSLFIQHHCKGDPTQMTTAHDVVSGCVAGVTAGAITTPLDVIKTYLQTQKRHPRISFLDSQTSAQNVSAAAKMVGEEGPHIQPTSANSKPSTNSSLKSPTNPSLKSTAATLSKFIPKSQVSHAPFYPGVFSAATGIYRRQGLAGLFSGVGVRMIWTGSQSTIMFVLYEFLLDLARKQHRQHHHFQTHSNQHR